MPKKSKISIFKRRQVSDTKIAILDIGSARLKLQIAEICKNKVKLILSEKYESQLAANVQKDKTLDVDFVENSFLAKLKLVSDKIKANQCTRVLVIGTHALRSVENSEEVLSIIKRVFKQINIIPPWVEGAIIHRWMSLVDDLEDFAFLDVGGGSVQLSFGSQQSEVYSVLSGTFTLEKLFQDTNEYSTETELEEMREYIVQELDKANIAKRRINFLYFGSNCMKSFIASAFKAGKIGYESIDKIPYAKFEELFNKIKGKEYSELGGFYPENKLFMHGADKALLNLMMVCKALNCYSITPTNESLSSALLHLMGELPDELTNFKLNISYI